MTYAEILAAAIARLKAAAVDNPQLDARLLLEAVSGLTRAGMLLKADDEMPVEQYMVYGSLIDRRLQREPVARILGVREFWGLPFRLSAGTLEPRPDSEVLVEAMLNEVPDRNAELRILDLGTGTGCLLAALLHELPSATGLAIDKNPLAVETAKANLAELGLEARAEVREGNWAAGIEEVFDLVISNPPYIREDEMPALAPEVTQHDPALALVAGADGLDAYRAIIALLPRLLKAGGVAVLELGAGQGDAVSALLPAQSLKRLTIQQDFGGIPRALVIKK